MTHQNPEYPTSSVYLNVRDAAKAIEFYQTGFGATERYRLTDTPTGRIVHAELEIEGGLVMLAEENPIWGNLSPAALGGTPVTLCLIVDNADLIFDRAVAAGATVKMPLADQFYGFRSGNLEDPFGHRWMIQHQLETVSPAEMQNRWDRMTPGANCATQSE